ncbi:hypothetical protein B6D60_07855 [candidate division KSB1 bacterium 4484_87]|nr:MAG: hypothetical protein B6D60_07855 [candidate division KSB1 bacterium 4484_87]
MSNQEQNKFLDISVQFVKGIGEKRAQALNNAGIFTIRDLLQYYPRRYLDRSNITVIRDLKMNDLVTVVGTVQACGVQRGRKARFVLMLSDNTGRLNCVWFNQIPYWEKKFKPGQIVAVSGKIGYFGGFQMVHPEFDILSDDEEVSMANFYNTGQIIPIYSSSEALSRVGLDSRGFRRILNHLVKNYLSRIDETLPKRILSQMKLLPLQEALRNIHFPGNLTLLKEARRRLKFEEFFLLEFLLAYRKKKIIEQEQGIAFPDIGDRVYQLAEKLPFKLTPAQRKVLQEIWSDMKKPHPMYRLIQGDVGSGKTIIALIAMLLAVENGYQAALMAPTEILAEQHYLTFKKWLAELDIHVELLVGAQKVAEREEILKNIVSGKCHIVIGTHALIQEHVKFANLGLIVIDEQHRFGVAQRADLKQKGANPDVLVMTATPIPRTLSLTLYGDLDISVIDELPEGRKPIITSWRYSDKRKEIYKFVKSHIDAGAQAYIVFPLVEESEKLDLKAATESYEVLQNTIFKGNSMALLHGRMKNDEKEAVMAAFKDGEIQILVSTTVIEVGVDVPNASIMVIENAERFGLTQLHQLRGRVGRGEKQSYCILIAKKPASEEALTRLTTMASTNDGFKIAEVDLQLRGPGEFLGTRQHGLPEFKIANPLKDGKLLQDARKIAFACMENENDLNFLLQAVKKISFYQQFKHNLSLMRIG